MAWNGSGVWSAPSLPGSFNPAITGQNATAPDWNSFLTALSGTNGISNLICRDGQTTITADLPMSGFRHTGVGAAGSTDEYGVVLAIANTGYIYGPDTGAADAYAMTPTPVISAYAVGQLFRTIIVHTNATTTPTLAVSGLTAGTIVTTTGGALVAGALLAGAAAQFVVTNVTTGTPTFQLITPIAFNQNVTGPTYQSFTTGTAATYTRPAGVKWIKIRMAGAGGGGGGVGQSTAPTGGTGGDTIFNSINAAGATGGTGNTGAGAAFTSGGGAGGTGGSGSVSGVGFRVSGTQGDSWVGNQGAATVGGGKGGGSAFFNGGAAFPYQIGNVAPQTGLAGTPNTGGGGSGAVGNGTAGGQGGGGGESVEFVIVNPAGTYTYTIGAAGAGGIGTGTGAATGGAGAAGFIVVEEHYNY